MILTRAHRTRLARSPGLLRLGALGVLNPGLAYALSLLGLAHITASLSVLPMDGGTVADLGPGTVDPARWILRDHSPV